MTDARVLTCDGVRDLAPLYVLDALEADEAAAVRAHLATCPDPHAELAELAGVVPYLADALVPLEPPPALGERIAAAVQADLRASTRDEPAAARLPGGLDFSEASVPPVHALADVRTARRPRPAWRWVLEAAAVIALVGVVGWDLVLQGQLDGARHQASLLGSALTAAAQAGSVTASLQGTGPAAAASGFVVASHGGTNYLVVSGLPDPGAGRTYQAWYLEGQTAVSAGVFPLGTDGVTVVDMAGVSERVSAVALTIEPNGGSSQPTSRPIVLANLTS